MPSHRSHAGAQGAKLPPFQYARSEQRPSRRGHSEETPIELSDSSFELVDDIHSVDHDQLLDGRRIPSVEVPARPRRIELAAPEIPAPRYSDEHVDDDDDDVAGAVRRYYQRLGWLFGFLFFVALGAAGWAAYQYVLPLYRAHQSAVAEIDDLKERLSKASAEMVILRAGEARAEAKQAELEMMIKEREDALNLKAAALAEIQGVRAELEQKLAGEIKRGDVLMREARGTLVVDLRDKILFASGDATLDDRGKAVLKKVGDSFRALEDKMIIVGGHTDSVPITGPLKERFVTNWELSSARALNVVHFLQDEAQIAGERLIAEGHGEFRPIADNKTNTGRKRNRRIEVVLAPKPPKA